MFKPKIQIQSRYNLEIIVKVTLMILILANCSHPLARIILNIKYALNVYLIRSISFVNELPCDHCTVKCETDNVSVH